MVAREKGAKVLVSEVNPQRLAMIRELGFAAIDPQNEDIKAAVEKFTSGALADVVFEVSGTASGVAVMTELARVRGRIVMVAIHSEPKPVDLFRFFWRELRLQGVRVYEPEDFDEAIALAAEGRLALDRLITKISPLDDVQTLFETIDRTPDGMKYLIKCS
jgi:(R,R)-butanediol dehydrogenase / meso-butanediol dehydrogenase / diacetyl reductase